MAKPKQIILTEDGVITPAALTAYVEGRLSDSERTEMDRLLQGDPFSQEALEGLRAAGSLASLPAAITAINTTLREKTGAREKKKAGIEIHWSVFAYTGVILAVLLGIGFVIIQVLAHRAQAANTTSVAQESVPMIEDKKPEAPAMDTLIPMIDSAEGITVADTTPADNGPSPAAAADDRDMSQDAISRARQPATPEIAALLDTARRSFTVGNYPAAEKLYNKALAAQPDNLDALYFGGVSGYLNESKGLGEANFDKLIKAGFYTDGTKWYKANILIRRGQKSEAKQLLRDLVNSNSIYKDRAIKKYEELYQ